VVLVDDQEIDHGLSFSQLLEQSPEHGVRASFLGVPPALGRAKPPGDCK
jgi:hypothetical protein